MEEDRGRTEPERENREINPPTLIKTIFDDLNYAFFFRPFDISITTYNEADTYKIKINIS
jgi:hypothetical protein